MKRKLMITMLFLGLAVGINSLLISKPSFNGNAPGCAGGGCHNLDAGSVSAFAMNNMDVEITLSGVGSGKKVAGELVDSNGNVVAFVDATRDNPFILTAPGPGTYLINAGHKDGGKKWDSVSVTITVPTGISDDDNPALIDKLELFPNHPNPFNPETVIRFAVNKASSIELSIFNIRGQKIRTLALGNFSVGVHTLRWDGRDDAGNRSPSGIYLLSLTDGQSRYTQKMILAK